MRRKQPAFKWLAQKTTGDDSGGGKRGGAEVAAQKSPVPDFIHLLLRSHQIPYSCN